MMMCGIPTMEEEILRFEEDKAMGSGNISSTLQKLYMWEKKLLEEVKVYNLLYIFEFFSSVVILEIAFEHVILSICTYMMLVVLKFLIKCAESKSICRFQIYALSYSSTCFISRTVIFEPSSQDLVIP
jgi:hypothetical protein